MMYVVGKFMERVGIKIYDVLLTCDKKIPAYDAEKTKEKVVSALKLLKKIAYDELII